MDGPQQEEASRTGLLLGLGASFWDYCSLACPTPHGSIRPSVLIAVFLCRPFVFMSFGTVYLLLEPLYAFTGHEYEADCFASRSLGHYSP
jgi:hypothetical protein